MRSYTDDQVHRLKRKVRRVASWMENALIISKYEVTEVILVNAIQFGAAHKNLVEALRDCDSNAKKGRA